MMIRLGHYESYNIERVIQPYTVYMKDPYNFNDGNNRYYKIINNKFYFCGGKNRIEAFMLDDDHIPHMDTYQKRYPHHYPSSWNAAVGYSVLDTGATEIELIGMDFYDVGYLADGGPGGPESGKHMKESIIKFINDFRNIQFSIYTSGDFNYKSPNLKIIKIK